MADFDPSTLVPTPGTLNPANLVPTDQYNRAQENKATEDASEEESMTHADAAAKALPDWIKNSAVTKGVIGALNAPMANDAQLEQFRLDHPILGAFEPVIKVGEGVDRALLQSGTRAVGALPGVNDETVRRTLQQEQAQIPVTGPLATTGAVVGNIASMVATPGSSGRAGESECCCPTGTRAGGHAHPGVHGYGWAGCDPEWPDIGPRVRSIQRNHPASV